jgi:hypothetical protein
MTILGPAVHRDNNDKDNDDGEDNLCGGSAHDEKQHGWSACIPTSLFWQDSGIKKM